jgi:hypothetical protein
MVMPGWWKRWPFLPLPSRSYLVFRLETMYGSGGGALRSQDLLGYLEWCQWVRSSTLRSSHARSDEYRQRG